MTISEYLEKNNMKHSDLAKKAKVHQSMLCNLFAGRRKITPYLALKLEKATNGEIKATDLVVFND